MDEIQNGSDQTPLPPEHLELRQRKSAIAPTTGQRLPDTFHYWVSFGKGNRIPHKRECDRL